MRRVFIQEPKQEDDKQHSNMAHNKQRVADEDYMRSLSYSHGLMIEGPGIGLLMKPKVESRSARPVEPGHGTLGRKPTVQTTATQRR